MDLIYGPVTSQRFGSVLGVNLLGQVKVCSYNCVYCHLGPTEITMNKIRKEYVFPEVSQLREAFYKYVQQNVVSEAIVISGNGEPTLHPQFDECVQALLELRETHLPGKKIFVLSNGAHLDSKKVVLGMNQLDERVFKVDAGQDTDIAKVNDPLVRINMTKLLSGVRKLKDCIVQSLFVGGEISNATPEAIEDWIEVIGMIKPKAVQLCTMSRPGFSPRVHAVTEDVLDGIAFRLKKRVALECEVFPAHKT